MYAHLYNFATAIIERDSSSFYLRFGVISIFCVYSMCCVDAYPFTIIHAHARASFLSSLIDKSENEFKVVLVGMVHLFSLIFWGHRIDYVNCWNIITIKMHGQSMSDCCPYAVQCSVFLCKWNKISCMVWWRAVTAMRTRAIIYVVWEKHMRDEWILHINDEISICCKVIAYKSVCKWDLLIVMHAHA